MSTTNTHFRKPEDVGQYIDINCYTRGVLTPDRPTKRLREIADALVAEVQAQFPDEKEPAMAGVEVNNFHLRPGIEVFIRKRLLDRIDQDKVRKRVWKLLDAEELD